MIVHQPKIVNSAEASKYNSEFHSVTSQKERSQSIDKIDTAVNYENMENLILVDQYFQMLAAAVTDPDWQPDLAFKDKYAHVQSRGYNEGYNDKRDSFFLIAGSQWNEMQTIGIAVSEEDQRELLADYKLKKSRLSQLYLAVQGEVVNLADTLTFPQSSSFESEKPPVLARSWPAAKQVSVTPLRAPMSMNSKEAQSLYNPNFKSSPAAEFDNFCKTNRDFSNLVESMEFIDTEESFIHEGIWLELDCKKQNQLMDIVDTYYSFLPFHHAKLTRPRRAKSSELKDTVHSNFYDKLFSALVFFNKVMMQDAIRSLMNKVINPLNLTPAFESPLGWLGSSSVSNLYPLDKNYQPLFMLACGNHYLTAAKMLIAKLTAKTLGCWAALELGSFNELSKALQLGDWLKVDLKCQSEVDYLAATSKRVMGFDNDNNVWVKGPRGLLTKSNVSWCRLDTISNMIYGISKVDLSTLYVKSAGELYKKRLLIGYTESCQMLVASIKETEDSEDQASSYMIQFQIEQLSDDATKLYIIETELITQPGSLYRIIELNTIEKKSNVFFMNWGAKKAFFLSSVGGILTVKITFSSKVNIAEKMKLNNAISPENSPSKRAKGVLTLEEGVQMLAMTSPLRKGSLKAEVLVEGNSLKVNYSK